MLECWGQWRTLYRNNKKMKFKVDKVKKVLKPNSKEYYNYLDKMNKNMLNQRKKDIKETRGSILKTNESKFEIRELPDNPGSNFSSVKKESHVADANSELNIGRSDQPLKLGDVEAYVKHVNEFGNICLSLQEYLNFEVGGDVILDMIAGSKPKFDESFHNFVVSYKRVLPGGAAPTFVERDKDAETGFDWNRFRGDSRELKMMGDSFHENINLIMKNKLELKTGKKKLKELDPNLFKDFLLEKYRVAGGKGGVTPDKSDELFDSNIKEDKEAPGKGDFDFEMNDGEDVFDRAKGEKPKKEPTTFALDQESDAFTDFNSKKKEVGNSYLYFHFLGLFALDLVCVP